MKEFFKKYFDMSFGGDNKDLLPFFYLPLAFVLYAIYYDLSFLKYQPSLHWYFAKAWFVVGPFFLIHLRTTPKEYRPLLLALHWIFYGAYNVYFVSLSYYIVFIQVTFIFSVMVIFSRIQYLIFASAMLLVSSLAIFGARNEMLYVAQGMSAKPEIFINNICMQVLCYLVYYFATVPKLKLIESEKQFAKLGKSSGFIMHEITKPILRMNQNPERFEEELVKINEIITIARAIKNGDESNLALEEVNLSNLINDTLSAYKPFIDGFKIDVKLKAQVQVIKTDANLIKFVLDNLIKNSIEASADYQGERFVEISFDSEVIRVKNSYIENEHLAEDFFRPMMTTKAGHMGVGLYISKSIADNLGYAIEINTYKDVFEVQVKLA